MKKVHHHYHSYQGIVSTTIPGRCYSIAELLRRVQRGEALPRIGRYEEDSSNPSDEDIEHQFQSTLNHPFNDRDSDEIDAFVYLQDTESRFKNKSFKPSKKHV